jgi:hypothetical protein
MRFHCFLICLSVVLLGFAFAMVPKCDADYPVTEAGAESTPIVEADDTPPQPQPGGVAPAPSTGGGAAPKAEASPSASNSPAAASSPAPSLPSANASSSFADILHPDRWKWPHDFTLTDPNSWPFIPVPEIATDPNGGTTGGVLGVVLYTDTKNQITDIFAPDI